MNFVFIDFTTLMDLMDIVVSNFAQEILGWVYGELCVIPNSKHMQYVKH